ncbi:uncharacterized protein LOC134700907 [Mytilus trossulus]|uniref:uncharacterized protein LOC134700907 n=1 Tax=Mytilus trossulus TaxID=6551 RepID=UPI0030074852
MTRGVGYDNPFGALQTILWFNGVTQGNGYDNFSRALQIILGFDCKKREVGYDNSSGALQIILGFDCVTRGVGYDYPFGALEIIPGFDCVTHGVRYADPSGALQIILRFDGGTRGIGYDNSSGTFKIILTLISEIMAPLSEEEENYVRLALLLKGVTPRVVRTYFDREFPPTSLPSTLSTSKNTLWDLKLNRVINQAQWNLLYPRNGVVDSKTFDVTLMICLIRNLTSINPPINGFDALPPPGEKTPASDLARIKCYRNKLAHHDNNTINMTYFNAAWRDISNAVSRLGGQTMYQDCQDLKVKILDQSNKEIILEIKQSLKEIKELKQTVVNLGMEHSQMTESLIDLQTSHNDLQTSHNTLQTEHSIAMNSLNDPIPWNIKELIKKQLEDWEKNDKMFVSTRASDYAKESLQENNILTLTAPSGVGKSSIARHTALLLRNEGYNIIPVYTPTDIRTYYQPGKQTVFIVDDICGNFTANQQQIDNWKQLLPVIDTIIADKYCKIIVSCKLQVYKDEKFNILSNFKSNECNLISDKLGLTSVEKTKIANTYIGTRMKDLHDLSQKYEFFPLLCSLYPTIKKDVDVKEFFKTPFTIYKNELDELSEHGNEGKYRICSLALCVLSNNHLEEKWFQGKLTKRQKLIIQDTYNSCGLDRGISKAKLQHALDTLDGTFICKQNGIYRILHDKLFDFLAHYFGQKMIECLIDHGSSGIVHTRLIWQKSPDDENSNIDFIIEIPDNDLETYLKRCIEDWSSGNVTVVFINNNMKRSSFRQQLLQYIQQLKKSEQVTLANTRDTVIPKEICGSGNTPLIITCYNSYTDMVQWMLCNEVDVDQCRDDGITGLFMASQNGYHDIVKLLLENNSYVDLCDKNGCSPLYIASQNGHTAIVKLLLENNPNVDLCDKNGCSPLYRAIQRGHTDIVKLLLENNHNVDLCNKDGCSPLHLASQNGHTAIVNLLLEKNPNVDLCDKDGFTPLINSCACSYTSIVQLLIKHKPNIDAQTYEGCNALIFSALTGNLEITQLLVKNNADCNVCSCSKQSLIDTIKGQSSRTLEEEKQGCFDYLIKEASSHVADYIWKKTVNYVFDMQAGCSPLHFACFMDRLDVVRCLLDHNANINMTNEDETTPLFFACEVGHEDIV